jgi:dimethylhistidine N-methyltransferase
LTREISSKATIHNLGVGSGSDTFASDVRLGLTSHPKALLPKYFYDEMGSYLFEAICCLPEYYVTRAESDILHTHADRIVERISSTSSNDIRLIELGCGTCRKTRFFIEAILRRQTQLDYLPIDFSEPSLERSLGSLLNDYPQLRITAYAADYADGLQRISESRPSADSADYRNVAMFLGSSIGNLDPEEALVLLRQVRNVIRPGDVLLQGADLKKDASILKPAYNDALGVTSAFNLNLLVRINRELDGDFDVMKFEHRAIYNEALGRIEMHLFSREPQKVRVRKLELEIGFDEGESIHTENSYKFEISQLAELARTTGFSLEETWYDRDLLLSLNLFVAR